MGGGHVFAARPAAVLPVADEAPSGQSGGDKPRHGGIRCRSVLRRFAKRGAAVGAVKKMLLVSVVGPSAVVLAAGVTWV